ncbi:hypothetical protein Indivirus_1_97 [Indivirus ILV1]|uniref:C2H2-type domain-containing protein n=1 Tax=Indivirus ILV1 TaxID=1977633 RepID=A0A1V0SCW4_9VIRU|nr:hypothetical protein Indivirus_1_97 [Indivirus ILV1]
MANYTCSFCNFKSNRKNDYTRHIQSKRHLEKVTQPTTIQVTSLDNRSTAQFTQKEFKCTNCDNIFTRSSSLLRHKKVCMETIIDSTKVSQLEKENERLQNELSKIGKQVETYEMMLKSFTSPQIINYFNYICTNYPNTPVLESQKSYINLLEAKTMTLIEVITMYHQSKNLINFIGDYIIKTYKKKEPSEQSFWSTDITRLTYIIREACKGNDDIWSYDKKGVKIKKIVIDPALKYIKDSLIDFCKENGASTDEPEFSQLKAALEIIPTINSGSLADDILKYIAPEFTITHGDNKAIVKV